MGVKEYQFAGDNRHLLNEYHRQLDSLGEWIIQFDAFDKQDYGFDKVSNKKGIYSGSEYYPYLSGNYDLRFKSVECGKTDKVIVDFGSYPEKDNVIFKDKYGVTLKLSKGNVLNFTGVAKPDTNYIYAYRGDQKIGKLSVNTYKQKTYKVVFVRVNGAAKKLNAKEITKYLNKVYNQCAVSIEDSIDDITICNLTSFSHGGSGILTVYNDDQKKVLQAYDPQMQDGVYYLFFIDNVTDKKDGSGTLVSGYMPRGYNCGFIYDGGSEHTVAHELGHGIAGLEHVFSDSKSSGKTKNLMDYADGEELWHFQWDEIQDPSRVWMKWRKVESEGEMWIFYDKNSEYFNKIVYEHLTELNKCPSFKFLYDVLWGIENKIILIKQVSHNDNLYKNDYKTTRGFWDANKSSLCLFYDDGNNYNYNIATIVEEFFHAAHYFYLKYKKISNLSKVFMTQTEIEVELFKSFVLYYLNTHKQEISLVVNSKELDPFSISNDKQVVEGFKYICSLLPWMKNGLIYSINTQDTNKFVEDFYEKIENLINKTPYIYQHKLYGSYKSMDYNQFDIFLPFLFNCILR